MFLVAEAPGCKEGLSPVSNSVPFLPTDAGSHGTGQKALPPFPDTKVMRGHRWAAAHGSIYDFKWLSRAHPCEHTQVICFAHQSELQDLELRQCLSTPGLPSCAITACCTVDSLQVDETKRKEGPPFLNAPGSLPSPHRLTPKVNSQEQGKAHLCLFPSAAGAESALSCY